MGTMTNLAGGVSNSKVYNEYIAKIIEDVDNLFSINNDNADMVDEALEVYVQENKMLKTQLSLMQLKLAEIEENVKSIRSNDSTKTLFKSLSNIRTNSNITGERNIVTLPTGATINKLAIRSNDEIYMPESLKIQIYESKDDSVYEEVDSSTNFIKNEYWTVKRKIPTSENITKVYARIRITVPVDMINNVYSNVLKIVTYPAYGITIEDIGYADASGNLGSIPHSGEINIFNDTNITTLDVLISQSNYSDENGYRVFVYGLKELGLYYYDFLPTGWFVVPFSIENSSMVFNSIKEPEEINGVTYQLYADSNLTSEIWFEQEDITDLQTVYLKVNLKKADVVPVLRDVKLKFNVRDA